MSRVSTTSVGSLGGMGVTLTIDTKKSTNRKRTLKLISTVSVPIIALIIQNCVMMSSEVNSRSEALFLIQSVSFGLDLGQILHMTQRERGSSVLFLNSQRRGDDVAALTSRHGDTDRVFVNFFAEVRPGDFLVKYDELRNLNEELKIFRSTLWSGNQTVTGVIEFYTDKNADLEHMIGESAEKVTDANLWTDAIASYMLVKGKEHMGFVEADGVNVLAQGSVPLHEFSSYCFHYANGLHYINRSRQFSDTISAHIANTFDGSELDNSLEALQKTILMNNGTGSFSNGQRWLKTMSSYIDILWSAEVKIGNQLLLGLKDLESGANTRLYIDIFLVIATIFLLPIVVIFVTRMTSTIRSYANRLKDKTLDLKRERKRVENLLSEILPFSIAEKLVNKETIVPEHYNCATLYFHDIVGFTAISSKSSPLQVVELLNDMYRTCDEIIGRYDVYKVETIGDAYMVASGLPEKNGHDHSLEIALMSLHLVDSVPQLSVPHLPGEKLRVRIGLHTGPVVAGVVGIKMPRYCLFGETVITAQMMESTGLPNKIHISARTKTALEQDHGGFDIIEREEAEVKGKMVAGTYLLIGRDDSKKYAAR